MLPRCCSLASSHCHAEHNDLQFPRKNSRMRLIDIGCAVVESQFFFLAQPLSDKVPFAVVCLKPHKVRHRNVPPGCWWAPCGVAPSEGLAMNRGTIGQPTLVDTQAFRSHASHGFLQNFTIRKSQISRHLQIGHTSNVTTVTYIFEQDRYDSANSNE